MARTVLKVRIRKVREEGKKGTSFHWPAAFIEASDAHGAMPVVYEDTGALGDNVMESALVVVTKEEWLDKLLEHPDIQEIEPEAANELGRDWQPATTIITDEPAIIEILRKVKNGEELTPEEQAVIDEDDAAPGVLRKEFNVYDYIFV